ncbi:NAD-dependent protein deacetylase 1 [Actinosynnema sp. ALI-1.44]|uniref:NAD-dependent protein deacetylase n=1 Tax=Actinosynnema sp. ALI-1.44 TaxID=1933779 RepID=UPI00097C2DB1|nr:NAD-dependent protein deacetylase [Actinosynnema sp. ALI-1.44]ONI82989.1 NAD-dependent protein deacetylase 1 [Actinosynnema sp. ALI-1.44]
MRTRPTLSYNPVGDPLPTTTDLTELAGVVAGGSVAVLSGAGLSTESGIPDYRGASGSLRRAAPMTYDEFVGSVEGRRRYWARSHVGWRTIARAHPNDGHRAVAALCAEGYVAGVITQNVDGLHQAAGTPEVVELHGSLDRVVCLDCRATSPREDLDRRLHAANPSFTATAIRVNPDGDVDLAEEHVREFQLVACADCETGVLKPDVVFFGENVPRDRVEQCYRMVDEAKALVVLGSSLTVMSGLRFVRYAAKSGKPVAIVNRGRTRGDEYAGIRVDLPLGRGLTDLTRLVGTRRLR